MLLTMSLWGLVYFVPIGVVISTGAGVAMLVIAAVFSAQLFASDKVALAAMATREVSAAQAPELHEIIERFPRAHQGGADGLYPPTAGEGASRAEPPRAAAARPAISPRRTYEHRQEESMPGLMGRISTLIKAKISPEPGREPDRNARLRLRAPARGSAERQERDRRRCHGEEAPAAAGVRVEPAGREARRPGSRGAVGRARGSRASCLERKQLIVGEVGSLDQQVSELESEQEKLTAAEQQLGTKVEAFGSKKEVIKAEYSAAEAQVRISEAATGVGDEIADVGLAMQRALDKTETMKARASAVEELQAAGTFEDLTALGTGQDDVDRQLEQLGAKSAVNDELAKQRAELGTAAEPAEISATGQPEGSAKPAANEQPQAG
jgi:phage shock protein A